MSSNYSAFTLGKKMTLLNQTKGDAENFKTYSRVSFNTIYDKMDDDDKQNRVHTIIITRSMEEPESEHLQAMVYVFDKCDKKGINEDNANVIFQKCLCKKNKDIAEHLLIPFTTLKKRVSRFYKSMHVGSFAEAARKIGIIRVYLKFKAMKKKIKK